MSRLLARLGATLGAGLALLLGFAPAASAHVTVHSSDAVHGGTAEIAFRVPTESNTARTVKLQVQFPSATPLAKVHVLPHPGWTYKVTKSSLPAPLDAGHGDQVSEVVGQIEWAATTPDAGIKPGEYDVFRISAGPLPKTDRIVFKVVQTYDDGQISRWIDEPASSGSEPQHPAAVLNLASTSDTAAVANMGHAMPVASSTSSSSGTPMIAWLALGITGAAVVAALWAVLISMRAARRRGGDEAAA